MNISVVKLNWANRKTLQAPATPAHPRRVISLQEQVLLLGPHLSLMRHSSITCRCWCYDVTQCSLTSKILGKPIPYPPRRSSKWPKVMDSRTKSHIVVSNVIILDFFRYRLSMETKNSSRSTTHRMSFVTCARTPALCMTGRRIQLTECQPTSTQPAQSTFAA